MKKTIEIRIEYHICHELLVHDINEGNFSTFDRFCSNFAGYINRYYNNGVALPTSMKRLMYKVVDKIQLMFGISQDCIFNILFNFLDNKLWLEDKDIIIDLKKYYDPVI